MDGSKSDDRNGGGKEKKPPRSPRSVREGLGGEGSRRRQGRKDRRSRPGRDPAVRPPRAGPPPATPPGARIARQVRDIEIDGVGWRVEVVGSSASPGERARSVRLLEVRFETEEGSALDRTGYVPGVDLDGVDADELRRLGRRLRDRSSAPPPRSGKGRRAKSRP